MLALLESYFFDYNDTNFLKDKIIEGFINYGVSSDLQTSKYLQTPLHMSSISGSIQCAEKLLSMGAEINLQVFKQFVFLFV